VGRSGRRVMGNEMKKENETKGNDNKKSWRELWVKQGEKDTEKKKNFFLNRFISILGYHGGAYNACGPLGCKAGSFGAEHDVSEKDTRSPSSGPKRWPREVNSKELLPGGCILPIYFFVLFFSHEDGINTFLRNVGLTLPNYIPRTRDLPACSIVP
jgi:hypothetical protein